MTLKELTDKKILILGYGREGKATERFLKQMAKPRTIDVSDQSIDPRYLEKQAGYDLVIKTPGIQKKFVTVPYTTATNIFFANCPNLVVGVTGSKGKSTTASLIQHILTTGGKKSRLVGNIGNPALEALLEPIQKDDIFVMELSSYQLDDISYSPHISVILNLFPEHMNYHGDIRSYYDAKIRITGHLKPDDYFIFNSRYPALQDLANRLSCHIQAFDKIILPDEPVQLKGQHNKDNIRAAVAVCSLLGVTPEDAYRAVQSFQPLPHRLESIGTYHDIQFYDDAISTTPESTIAALNTIGPVGTLFLGGLDRGYNYSNLAEIIFEKNIPNLVLFPDAGEKIKNIIMHHEGKKPQILETKKMEEAVQFAFRNTPKGTICLLSTAAPSYSIWKNFEEKGDLFKRLVLSYAEKPADT